MTASRLIRTGLRGGQFRSTPSPSIRVSSLSETPLRSRTRALQSLTRRDPSPSAASPHADGLSEQVHPDVLREAAHRIARRPAALDLPDGIHVRIAARSRPAAERIRRAARSKRQRTAVTGDGTRTDGERPSKAELAAGHRSLLCRRHPRGSAVATTDRGRPAAPGRPDDHDSHDCGPQPSSGCQRTACVLDPGRWAFVLCVRRSSRLLIRRAARRAGRHGWPAGSARWPRGRRCPAGLRRRWPATTGP